MNSGVNIQRDGALQVYLKNICVASISAKRYNPECVVAMVTNLSSDEIPEDIVGILRENKIDIINVSFDRFRFPADYLWSLAFYKLCALSHLVELGFEKICYLDADVYIQGSFEALWQECDENLLLYDINHGLNTKDYQIICSEFDEFLEDNKTKYITHYGGEFFAANSEDAKRFLTYAEQVYYTMISRNFKTTKGDEFLVSISAHYMRESVKNAGAYIFRFWSGIGFRLVSTCYKYNAVTVLHLPAEKESGLLKIYDRFICKGNVPSNEEVWRICRLSKVPVIDMAKLVALRILKR